MDLCMHLDTTVICAMWCSVSSLFSFHSLRSFVCCAYEMCCFNGNNNNNKPIICKQHYCHSCSYSCVGITVIVVVVLVVIVKRTRAKSWRLKTCWCHELLQAYAWRDPTAATPKWSVKTPRLHCVYLYVSFPPKRLNKKSAGKPWKKVAKQCGKCTATKKPKNLDSKLKGIICTTSTSVQVLLFYLFNNLLLRSERFLCQKRVCAYAS